MDSIEAKIARRRQTAGLPVTGMRPVATAIADLFAVIGGPSYRYNSATRWKNTEHRADSESRTGHPWTVSDYDALIGWLNGTTTPEAVGRSRTAFITHARFLLDSPPEGDDACLTAAREAVAQPGYELPPRLAQQLSADTPARHGHGWEDGETEWMLRAVAAESPVDFIASVLQRTPGAVTSRVAEHLPPLFTGGRDPDEVQRTMQAVIRAMAEPRQFIAPAAGETDPIPRHRATYSREQCESLALLRCSGWTDDDIGRLLGEPDGISSHTDPGYGTDRVLLATLSDPALQGQLLPLERSRQIAAALDRAREVNSPAATGVWVKLPGFGWLVLCAADDAREGNPLTVYRAGTAAHSVAQLIAPMVWGNYALAAARPAPTQPATTPSDT